ncbi:response regulator [Sulfurimonas sp. MAG313]|nr:SpoIIE family protein phosphatase [Sulfurimonas sp. MAG313]MDF1881626.1 response regulator [Sulfurimonas sp. MAG313]
MKSSDDINIYKEMSVLVVDDNKTTLSLLKLSLEDIFDKVILAKNGEEGLDNFNKQEINLIITDYEMPILNGLEFIKKVRQANKTIPIILLTANEDYKVFHTALNLNITHSLSKPISPDAIKNVLFEILEPIFLYQSSKKLKKEELHTLQKLESYHKQQHTQAFLKEHQAIRNDFYYEYYKEQENILWYLDGSYKPHDILSGDTYSIRALGKDRAFMFIIDAMGKGVSASVTSILASSYINHIIDTKDFVFDMFLRDFNDYIIKSLLEEEVLAVVFAELNFSKHTLCISSYGMPPILMCDKDNTLIKIKTNNLPISKHNHSFNIQSHNIEDIEKILLCSDGLVESSLDNGELYFSHLKQDFIRSKTRSSFLKKMYAKVPNPDDDITLLFFQKRILNNKEMVYKECETRLKEVDKCIEDFHTYLDEKGIDPIHTAKLGMIFTEMMMNAYEHGNLGINNEQKRQFILEGNYEKTCTEKEQLYHQRLIKVHYFVHPQGKGHCVKFDICDEGEGFDTKIFKKLIFDTSAVNGRGFKIAKKMVDAIYYSPKGNHVILHKYVPQAI